MPELPEVEIVRRGLEKHLLGREIEETAVSYQPILQGDVSHMLHTSITSVRRFGKGLVIDFQNGWSLAIHLKMTGQIVYKAGKTSDFPHKHTHVIFAFKETGYLFYSDIRKFGWLLVVKTEEVENLPFFRKMGKEPLRDLTLDGLYTLLKKTKAPVKNILMHQENIAGIGNIYASEALFLAKIHPARQAQSLSRKEAKCLLMSLEEILRRALEKGGASSENFVNAEGERGTYQNHFLVYGRQGKPCLVCGELVSRIWQAGRSTFFCPFCQHAS